MLQPLAPRVDHNVVARPACFPLVVSRSLVQKVKQDGKQNFEQLEVSTDSSCITGFWRRERCTRHIPTTNRLSSTLPFADDDHAQLLPCHEASV